MYNVYITTIYLKVFRQFLEKDYMTRPMVLTYLDKFLLLYKVCYYIFRNFFISVTFQSLIQLIRIWVFLHYLYDILQPNIK